MALIVLFWILYKFALVFIFSCTGNQTKKTLHIFRTSYILDQQISNKAASNLPAGKRARVALQNFSSGEEGSSQNKKRKPSERPLPPDLILNKESATVQISSSIRNNHVTATGTEVVAPANLNKSQNISAQDSTIKNRLKHTINNDTSLHSTPDKDTKEWLDSLPNTNFFKWLKREISNAPNSQLCKKIVAQLIALRKLKVPSTFTSSICAQCTNLDRYGDFLNKVLVKCEPSGYALTPKLQKIFQHGIKLSNLSSMLGGAGHKSAEAFEALINTLTNQKNRKKLKKLKALGFEASNLSSMVNGAGHKCAETFEALINTLTNPENWEKLKKLKALGFEVSNLSSMVHRAGTKSPEAFEQLINKLTNPENREKLKKLKALGFEVSNLSSMVNGAGNKSAEAFEALIHKLSDENILDNLKKLKDLGFEVSNLSSMLNSASNKSAEAFEALIHKLSDQNILDNLKKLKDLGFEVSNLSSMVNGAGHKSPEAFEQLINKLGDENIRDNLKKLKDLGFEVSNLSSMVSGAGHKSAEAFEALIHKLSDENIRDNLKKLKDLGFEVSNLSSMVNGAGHKSPEAFEQLINKLTNKESFSKLETLQAQGIQCGHLSALVRGSGMKAFDALNDVINILTNDKYLDTIKKVSAAIYTTPDVINKNDEILVSSKASKLLKAIGDLRKQPSINDPSEHRQFKKFLTDCYAKGNHVEDSLLEVQRVSNDDPRKSLHGQDKVVAKKKIIKGTILGIYTGILLCEEDPIDHAVEFAYLATKGIYGVNKLNSYSFGIDLDTSVPLYLSACGRGNILAKINANQTYDAQSNDHQANKPNILALWSSCDGVTPFILFSATQDIPANTELLLDYGQLYWSDHNGNDDVSNPDANAYRSCLAQKKHYVGQSNSIMVLKLFNKHNPDLYQKLLEYIETPCFNALEGKDRMVECRKIDDANTIDYRIYKLPGEAAIGKPSQDYYSIDWNPSVGLDALNKYTYLFTPVAAPLISFDKKSGPIVNSF
ncbi:hypothetical protein [Cardinium endosymbiont of Philonthus spinipes]|uniref:hypothetical protein n=1 Tax=Cardinium endosymbiont of Philonthus spinipes TaxID=3077941 RepID=UPI00313ABF9F